MKNSSYFGLVVFFLFCLSADAHTDLTVQQAYTMIQHDPNIIVVDVREESEYCSELGHISGAYIYPYNSGLFQSQYTDFDSNEPVMLICRSGNRSNKAANYLDSQGFSLVYDVMGGTTEWITHYPTVSCVDSDKDGINDDLDNYPDIFNPTQGDVVCLSDFAEFASRWLMDEFNVLRDEDLENLRRH